MSNSIYPPQYSGVYPVPIFLKKNKNHLRNGRGFKKCNKNQYVITTSQVKFLTIKYKRNVPHIHMCTRRKLPINNDEQHTISIFTNYHYFSIKNLLQPSPSFSKVAIKVRGFPTAAKFQHEIKQIIEYGYIQKYVRTQFHMHMGTQRLIAAYFKLRSP